MVTLWGDLLCCPLELCSVQPVRLPVAALIIFMSEYTLYLCIVYCMYYKSNMCITYSI